MLMMWKSRRKVAVKQICAIRVFMAITSYRMTGIVTHGLFCLDTPMVLMNDSAIHESIVEYRVAQKSSL